MVESFMTELERLGENSPAAGYLFELFYSVNKTSGIGMLRAWWARHYTGYPRRYINVGPLIIHWDTVIKPLIILHPGFKHLFYKNRRGHVLFVRPREGIEKCLNHSWRLWRV